MHSTSSKTEATRCMEVFYPNKTDLACISSDDLLISSKPSLLIKHESPI